MDFVAPKSNIKVTESFNNQENGDKKETPEETKLNDTLNQQFGENWSLKKDIDDDSNFLDETSQSIKTKSAIGTGGVNVFVPPEDF